MTQGLSNNSPWLTVVGAAHNNLKNIDVRIPLQRFVCVTGVSGSGKSSLVNDIIREALARDLNLAETCNPGVHTRIDGKEHLDKVIDIDQSPIGRTPRSNPATYIKLFDLIRDLYTKLPDSKVRGYKPGRFSFNVDPNKGGGGRCEACEGNGANKIEMDFLADLWVTCPVCQGKRFSRETLHILYRGKSIADVLDMDVQEAIKHFENIPRLLASLTTLHDVGLDYIKLGQSSTTLSGGEAQRIKLARELVKRSTGRTLYLLDEPTTGLHFADIKKLLAVLHGFVDAGNTVMVIEHNLDVIKTADWVIDLGPEGGEAGGRIVAEGTPEVIAEVEGSYTGAALRPVLKNAETPRPGGQAARRNAETEQGATHTRQTPPNPPLIRGGLGGSISVVGARQHNLKNVSVEIPRGKMTVCCGPSGSGKSSLAMDTIYTEGQRRYVESLSSYARQFLGQMQKPKVDRIDGLSPAIAIEQKAASKSPRSTVGTVTEIYDYMRVLWARLGVPYCPKCDVPVGSQTVDEIVDRLMALGEGAMSLLLAPIEPAEGETNEALFTRLRANGFQRVRFDGQILRLDEPPPSDSRRRPNVEIVVDRITVKAASRARITESVEQCLAVGEGVMLATLDTAKQTPPNPPLVRGGVELRFSQRHSCLQCGTSYEELTPHHFSFNTRMGWCEACEGLGVQRGADPAAIAVHPTKSILDGALAGWGDPRHGPSAALLTALAKHVGFDPRTPWHQLSEPQRLAVLQGCGSAWITPTKLTGSWKGLRFRWRGYFPAIDQATRVNWEYRRRLEEMVTDVPCQACGGSRLKPESRLVRFGGIVDCRLSIVDLDDYGRSCNRQSKIDNRQSRGSTLHEICGLPLSATLRWFESLRLDARRKKIAGELLHEIKSRLRFLVDVGLDYVTLHRSAPTLSGGEAQRIQLASQIGSGLTGVLYVLDEPTIGLHPRDNVRLIAALQRLRDLGNTLIVVEHDREVISQADHVLDFGPGAGSEGGAIVAAAAPQKLRTHRHSLTGQYLSNRQAITVPSNRRAVRDSAPSSSSSDGKRRPKLTKRGHRASDDPLWLVIERARHNNLKEIDVHFPLSRFTCVTGPSGSGKSSLVSDILHNALAARLHRARLVPGAHDQILGLGHLDKVVNVDQSPIGNSPTSNPATYTGLFDVIRELFARLPESKVRGFSVARFSFNMPGGRCEACEGNGQRRIEMHFLPDVWVECESCRGTRYTSDLLQVAYRGKNIAEVLNMQVREALDHFANVPKLKRMLETLNDVGLGYIQLGQSAPTLSGGEAQRVKLAAELGRPSTGRTLYILDEPTTGLHFDDLKKLLNVLHRLVDLGNTVVCIEHNLDVIKTADWVIDLGPEAGDDGGRIVVAGTPETVVECDASHTGRALKPILEAGPVELREVYDTGRQKVIEREFVKPLKLTEESLGQMPWQRDGRRWHTVNHVDMTGAPVLWKPEVLEWLIDTVQSLGPFEPADWNHRSRVEVKAKSNAVLWFCHARTGGRSVLDVSIRTPVGTFKETELRKQLGIKTLDERTDLPIYGSWPRVGIDRQLAYEDVRLYLHDMDDVSKTAFRRLLKEAADAYFKMVGQVKADPAKAEPWSADGRDWHLSQRSIMPGRTKRWTPALLLEWIGRFRKSAPRLKIDWSRKTSVGLEDPEGAWSAKVMTNQADGLRTELRVPKNVFTPTMIERLGQRPEIRRRFNTDYDQIIFWFDSLNDGQDAALIDVLRQCRQVDGREAAVI